MNHICASLCKNCNFFFNNTLTGTFNRCACTLNCRITSETAAKTVYRLRHFLPGSLGLVFDLGKQWGDVRMSISQTAVISIKHLTSPFFPREVATTLWFWFLVLNYWLLLMLNWNLNGECHTEHTRSSKALIIPFCGVGGGGWWFAGV